MHIILIFLVTTTDQVSLLQKFYSGLTGHGIWTMKQLGPVWKKALPTNEKTETSLTQFLFPCIYIVQESLLHVSLEHDHVTVLY